MYNAPVLRKGIEILRLVARTNEPLGVSDISRRLSIVKSTTLGILKALEEEGFLVQDRATKKYVPGSTLFEFSRRVLRSMELPFVAKPFLERLAEQVDETVILATREDDNAYRVLEVSEPKKELKITVPVGTRFPLYTGALMKVFFSQMTNEEIVRLVGAESPPEIYGPQRDGGRRPAGSGGAGPGAWVRDRPGRVPERGAGPRGARVPGQPRLRRDLDLRSRQLHGGPTAARHNPPYEKRRPVDQQEIDAHGGGPGRTR